MSLVTEQEVLSALRNVEDPELHKSLVELNMIRNIKVGPNNHVSLDVVLTISGCPLKLKIREDVEEAIKSLGVESVEVTFGAMTDEERAALSSQLRGESQNRPLSVSEETKSIAIVSGKGGVGKSTVSVNLAVSLALQGYRVGLIDADIYGFSLPDMMGIERRPVVIDDVVLPVESHGVKVISMGFFVEDNAPVVWRGPMLGKMLRNFLTEVHWGDLDYLLLDLPPGTGDVALDVHNLFPNCRELIVTTPHNTAAFVAARAGAMAIHSTKHEVLGVVENMSWFEAADNTREYPFGQGGGKRLAEELGVELLVQIPLHKAPAQSSVYEPSSINGEAYSKLADLVAKAVPVRKTEVCK